MVIIGHSVMVSHYRPIRIDCEAKTERRNGRRHAIDPEDEKTEEYLAKFKSLLIERLAAAIESDLQNDPDCVKGRKKTVQVG